MRVEIEPSRIEGEVGAPPSKSLGIRYVLLSLLTEVSLEQLPDSDDVKVATKVVQDLREGREELYLGGSATTLRMIIPILLAMGRKMKLDGDETLRRRPLRALKSLSAKFSSFNLPLTVEGHLNEEVEIEDGRAVNTCQANIRPLPQGWRKNQAHPPDLFQGLHLYDCRRDQSGER
ncbi:hypothetical protein [Metallosphaera hakonensis]|uniref:hypothetical protein n=1 Tax=Metallosphaera hakonensis TaxID=79601 RepID=UPI000A7589A7|nr:hypothetical protein [Metallosphaera hakonensis]